MTSQSNTEMISISTDVDMRKLVMERIPDQFKQYLEGVDRIWDRESIIRTNIERLGYKDIIMKPELDLFGDVVYKSYCKLNTLATQLGHCKSNALFGPGNLLVGMTKYTLKDLDIEIMTPEKRVSCKSIIPYHLNNKLDRNKNNYIYIDMDTSNILIGAALRRTKMKEQAKELKRCFDDIKQIYNLFITTINKEMANYINKLNTGKLPTSQDKKLVDAICATNSNSSQSKEEMCVEQEDMLREWIITQIDDKYRDLFSTVNKPWDKAEVLLAFFNTIKFKDIVLVPERYGRRNKIRYIPWYSITTLTNIIGGRVDLLKTRLLKSFDFVTIPNLELNYQSTQKEWTDNLIVPSHLKDNNYDKRLFVNGLAALTLVRHVAHKATPVLLKGIDIRSTAKELLVTMDSLDSIIANLIDDMNELVAEYRYQQQANANADMNNKLAAYQSAQEATKKAQEEATKEIEAKQKRMEEETKLFALRVHPDVDIKKTHYGYIFSSDDYMKKDLYKIGITDNLKNRERDAHTYHPEGGFLYTIETYNAKITEYALHQILKECRLQYKINSGDEWFKIPGLNEAKKLLNLAINNTDTVYEHVMTYPSQLRDRIINPVPVPTMLAIMPNNASVNEDPPIKEFIQDIANMIGNGNSICKTNLIKKLRDLANSTKYKKHKTKLPTEFDTFTASTNDNGIKTETKSAGRTTTIKFTIEITTTEDDH